MGSKCSSPSAHEKGEQMKKDWKYYLGVSLFFYSFLPMSIVAILPFLGLTLAQAGAFAVVFLASGEVAFLFAAALLGKEFLTALKNRIKAWFKRPHEPKPISRNRHRFGIALLTASFLPHYVMLIYLVFFSHSESEINFLAWTLVAGEMAFMAGLFILGGDFWDRLRELFVWPGQEMKKVPV
jgi:hypothetical protein